MKLLPSRKKPKKNRLVRGEALPRVSVGARTKAMLRKSTRHLLATGVALLATGLCAGLWRFVTHSERFAIRAIHLSTVKHVSDEELRRRLAHASGRNLFLLDRAAAERELAQHPWVKEARLRRRPPGTLEVAVTEREPAAVVTLGTLYLAEADGHIFKRASAEEADGLIVITGLDRDQYIDDPAGSQGLIREALEAAAAWRARGDRPLLSEVTVHPMLGLSLFLREGGIEVRLGRGELPRKLAQYDRLAEDLAARGEKPRALYFDSTTRPDRVTVRLQPLSPSEGG
jgi:cell division protein FtsQ